MAGSVFNTCHVEEERDRCYWWTKPHWSPAVAFVFIDKKVSLCEQLMYCLCGM